MRISWDSKLATAATVLGVSLLSACSTTTPPTAVVAPTTVPSLSSSPAMPAATTTTTNPTTTVPTTPAGTGTVSPTTSPPPAEGCAPTSKRRPTGAVTGGTVTQINDVDGDGRPDTGWIGGSDLFGITTASGATFSTTVDLSSPVARSMLVADVDGHGTFVALASDQRTVGLLVVKNCSLVPAQNVQGDTYYFGLGISPRQGTGVGCSQVAGTPGRGLVGLKLIRDSAGKPQSVQRTQIIITGIQARNGATDTIPIDGPQDAAAADTATQITCGTLTMAKDGVHGA